MCMQNYNSAINGLVKNSPHFLMASMILSFLLMLVIQMFYYATVFEGILPNKGFQYGIGFCIGVMVQSARLAFGLAGAYEFSTQRYGVGTLGLFFSLAITLFESFEVMEIAKAWSNGVEPVYNSLLLLLEFIIWTGLCLELRLAMNVAGDSTKTKSTNGKK